MTTEVSPPAPGRRAADLTVSILLMVVGLIAIVAVALLDIVLALTSADSPGDVEGATSLAFLLLFLAGAVWVVASILSIVSLVRRHRGWWLGVIAAGCPLLAGIIGFIAVTAVVK